jgi:hypothetical protein
MTTPLPPEAVTRAQDADDDWMFEYGGHKLPADHITALLDAAAPAIQAAERERIRILAEQHVARYDERQSCSCGRTRPDGAPCTYVVRPGLPFADLLGGETP